MIKTEPGNKMICVDGCTYEVEHTTGSSSEMIVVWDIHATLICDAEIDHNSESIAISYHYPLETVESSYSYYEYTTPDDLASWMVSTMPN